MEAYEPKWVNPVLNIIGVNSLKLGGLHICIGLLYDQGAAIKSDLATYILSELTPY